MIVSSLGIYFYYLTMFQLSFTIFRALHEPLLSIDFPSNEVNMIFRPYVEYIGDDLTAHSNCSATSKFGLLQSCPLPPHGISFLSFIGLCCFYNRYCPWFEANITPLRKMQRLYHRNNIPIMLWTPSFN